MEILVGRVNTVTYEGPPTGAAQASLLKNGEVQNGLPVTKTGSTYSVTLPYLFDESDIDILWTFSGVTGFSESVDQMQHLEVATPLLPISKVKEFLETTSDEEAVQAESAVRHIINAHCGQTFGRFVGAKSVMGDGSNALQLPAKLTELTDIDGITNLTWYEVSGGGYYILLYPLGAPPVKADYHGYHMHVGGVIHNPYNVKSGTWRSGVTYSVNGVWGWNVVPAAVQEAAWLLLNDYSCADSQYRDRYLTSMTAADWRIQFNERAFIKTGNVRADQLLNDYVLKHGWRIL
jgi:hypothetical protein